MKEQKEMFEEISEVLKVLAHPVRLSLVKIMLAKGPTNVTTMYGDLEMPQSTISQHLSKL
ncbi:ArsR/SmtB family transcription factor, partial [Bacillus anthracis]